MPAITVGADIMNGDDSDQANGTTTEPGVVDNAEWQASGILWHLIAVLGCLFAGILGSRFPQAIGVIGYSLVIIGMAVVIGGGLGFLFAIPRVATGGEAAVPATGGSPLASGPRQAARRLTTNTNLEKVSDWLTTMLVGVGLTQLANLDTALMRFRDFLATFANLYPNDPIRPAGALPVIGPMLLVTGLVLGFLYFYVFTRMVVAPHFNRTETVLAGDIVKDDGAAEAIKDVATKQQPNGRAAQAIARTPAPTVKDSLQLMFDALYEPGGYASALQIAEALKRTAAINDPDYWFYSAAAWGQQMKDLSGDAREKARLNALACARQAVALSPSYRGRLSQIADPRNFDNDLSELQHDPAFLAIVKPS